MTVKVLGFSTKQFFSKVLSLVRIASKTLFITAIIAVSSLVCAVPNKLIRIKAVISRKRIILSFEMNEVTLVKESYQLILKDFGLEDDKEIKEVEMAFDWLEDFLVRQVNYLLDHDFNHLLNALYRIDISENQVKNLLELSSSEEIALNIARAIIEREKQKVITRARYRNPL